ncbi:Phosphoglycerate mutase protein [Pseudomonas coronafaciens pv. striafaciens]|uniref:Phosphoglycerate mutase protein n=2 Tax=Pseudomonas coronafaciens TaxID=53409 RepID=A0A3M4YDF2_9PSED|nr:Phosphoglycerate mutase protein [Pseudomonas coronafaciens pv. striafaciens]
MDIWQVEEFTYLSPGRFASTTQADRKPAADDYWRTADAMAVDGPGAESFARLLARAQSMLDRLSGLNVENVAIFSHGQFIRAVAWLIKHGQAAGQPEQMREFRRLDALVQMRNCDSYQLALTDGRWSVDYNLTMEV